MKIRAVLASLVATGLAGPDVDVANFPKRQDLRSITDRYLFQSPLPEFISRRNARDPATLDWSSDNCTSSPDNPFGFPFSEACNRHDFGYQNYRIQQRFSRSAKSRIDGNFLSEYVYLRIVPQTPLRIQFRLANRFSSLYFKCEPVGARAVCRALAEVYYSFAVAYAGADATPDKREQADVVKDYEEKLAFYHETVAEAQRQGLLPELAK